MTPRRRILETLLYGRPDRVPMPVGAGRESTRRRWHQEGLPPGLDDAASIAAFAYREVGGREELPPPPTAFPLNQRMIPEFEERVLERRPGTLIVQDWKGNVCEISDRYSPRYLRNAIDFVTRRWIRCPVESRADWPGMRERYDALQPGRLPDDVERVGRELRESGLYTRIDVNGPFWQLREWTGFERLCLLFYDEPAFVREMVAFWQEYVAALLLRTFEHTTVDEVSVSEDMAYKRFSMISPAMVREFLLPAYRRWGEIIREAGCPIYSVDSDGYVGELLPIWMEAGVNMSDPMEVAAGNDLVSYSRTYGKLMAYRGGVDKRAMARGGAALGDEIDRVTPVIRAGGYLPDCDHGIPPDVSWADYLEFTRLLAERTGWL